MCRAILRGILDQRRREGHDPLGVSVARAMGTGIYALGLCGENEAVEPVPDQTKVNDEAEMLLEFSAGAVWDENTGEQLPLELVAASRAEELAFMKDRQVWGEVPLAESLERTGKRPLG